MAREPDVALMMAASGSFKHYVTELHLKICGAHGSLSQKCS